MQISLLYLGAAINKMFDPDWWNGHFFDFFLRDVFDISLYPTWIPPDNLTVAKAFGITTIFSEFLLGILVFIPKLTRLTIILGLIFHGGMLVITSGQLSVRFLYIMSAAFLLISNVKIKPIQIEHWSATLTGILKYLDLSDSLTSKTKMKSSFSITVDQVRYTGAKAFKKLFLSCQFLLSFYFISVILYMISGIIFSKIIVPILSF